MGDLAPDPRGDKVIGELVRVFLPTFLKIARHAAAKPRPPYVHPSLRRKVVVTKPAPLSTGPYLGPKRERKVKIPRRHRN